MAGAASADLVNLSWDITGGSYENGTFNMYGGVSDAAYANATIMSWGFSGVSADVYWNTGASYSNWASEARLGIYDMDIDNGEGDIYIWYGSPFSGINSGGDTPGGFVNYVGTDFSSGDVSANGYHIGSEGDIGAAGTSTWGDGSGSPAGIWTSGTVWVTIDTIPAPGALALLGLAGIAGMGRRRR
jgi:hypothetical protein